MLNSKLRYWFAFHSSASLGSERPIVHQDQLLDLPFPKPADMEEPQRAETAADQLAALMDEAEKAPRRDHSPARPSARTA